MKSTKQQLEKELQLRKPIDAVDIVYERSLTQAHNFKRKVSQLELKRGLGQKVPLYSLSGTQDMLFLIMEQCKSMEKERRFVQAWSSVRVWKKKDVSSKLGAV